MPRSSTRSMWAWWGTGNRSCRPSPPSFWPGLRLLPNEWSLGATWRRGPSAHLRTIPQGGPASHRRHRRRSRHCQTHRPRSTAGTSLPRAEASDLAQLSGSNFQSQGRSQCKERQRGCRRLIHLTETRLQNVRKARRAGLSLVGTTGFEPATPCSQSRCATELRHVPSGASVPGQGREPAWFARSARAGSALPPKAGKTLRHRPVYPGRGTPR